MSTPLSSTEVSYYIAGAALGIRVDGRPPSGRRPLTIETALLPTAAGSARATVAGGADVLVGVTASLSPIPAPALTFSVGVVPSAAAAAAATAEGGFGAGGAGGGGGGGGGGGTAAAGAAAASALTRLYAPAVAGPLGAAARVGSTATWVLSVDAVVLRPGGATLDVLSLAVRAALRTAVVAGVEVLPGEADDPEVVEVVDGEEVWVEDWGVFAGCPVAVSVTWVGEGVEGGDNPQGGLVVDASAEEEAVGGGTVVVGVCRVDAAGPTAAADVMDQGDGNADAVQDEDDAAVAVTLGGGVEARGPLGGGGVPAAVALAVRVAAARAGRLPPPVGFFAG
ncbi:hypothetical protein MMPV_008415 [Pyropia vietnamensis]